MTTNLGPVSRKQDENLFILKEVWSRPRKRMTAIFIWPPTPRNSKQFADTFNVINPQSIPVMCV